MALALQGPAGPGSSYLRVADGPCAFPSPTPDAAVPWDDAAGLILVLHAGLSFLRAFRGPETPWPSRPAHASLPRPPKPSKAAASERRHGPSPSLDDAGGAASAAEDAGAGPSSAGVSAPGTGMEGAGVDEAASDETAPVFSLLLEPEARLAPTAAQQATRRVSGEMRCHGMGRVVLCRSHHCPVHYIIVTRKRSHVCLSPCRWRQQRIKHGNPGSPTPVRHRRQPHPRTRRGLPNGLSSRGSPRKVAGPCHAPCAHHDALRGGHGVTSAHGYCSCTDGPGHVLGWRRRLVHRGGGGHRHVQVRGGVGRAG